MNLIWGMVLNRECFYYYYYWVSFRYENSDRYLSKNYLRIPTIYFIIKIGITSYGYTHE